MSAPVGSNPSIQRENGVARLNRAERPSQRTKATGKPLARAWASAIRQLASACSGVGQRKHARGCNVFLLQVDEHEGRHDRRIHIGAQVDDGCGAHRCGHGHSFDWSVAVLVAGARALRLMPSLQARAPVASTGSDHRVPNPSSNPPGRRHSRSRRAPPSGSDWCCSASPCGPAWDRTSAIKESEGTKGRQDLRASPWPVRPACLGILVPPFTPKILVVASAASKDCDIPRTACLTANRSRFVKSAKYRIGGPAGAKPGAGAPPDAGALPSDAGLNRVTARSFERGGSIISAAGLTQHGPAVRPPADWARRVPRHGPAMSPAAPPTAPAGRGDPRRPPDGSARKDRC